MAPQGPKVFLARYKVWSGAYVESQPGGSPWVGLTRTCLDQITIYVKNRALLQVSPPAPPTPLTTQGCYSTFFTGAATASGQEVPWVRLPRLV